MYITSNRFGVGADHGRYLVRATGSPETGGESDGEAEQGRSPGSPPGRPAAKSAWYVDPFGTAAERWWDGHRWTREVRGTPAAPAAGRTMRSADGTGWKQTRERTAEERTAEKTPRPKWMVRSGYLAAVLIPLLGVILGIMVGVRPQKGARGQGLRIITLSIVVFASAALLSRHR